MAAAAVFGDYDQAGLDVQYNVRVAFPDYEESLVQCETWSDATRQRFGYRLDVAFG